MRGKNSNFWTGINHKTERRKAMETLEYKNWRRATFEKDNYICVECGIKGNKAYLNADHIKLWAIYPELRYEVSNGQTLCRKCHLIKTIADKKLYKEYIKINKINNL